MVGAKIALKAPVFDISLLLPFDEMIYMGKSPVYISEK
jgi:hypothetical protein